jgi:hypothetical protein
MVQVDKAMRFISAPRVEVLLIPLDQAKNSVSMLYEACLVLHVPDGKPPTTIRLDHGPFDQDGAYNILLAAFATLVRNTPRQGRRAALCRLRNMMQRSIRLPRGIGARLHNRPVYNVIDSTRRTMAEAELQKKPIPCSNTYSVRRGTVRCYHECARLLSDQSCKYCIKVALCARVQDIKLKSELSPSVRH